MVTPFAVSPFRIEVTGRLVSQPYVHMTVEMMHAFGAETRTNDFMYFETWPIPWYQARSYDIEPDATAASYFFAAAAITEGQISVRGVGKKGLQGDSAFLNALDEMGCKSQRNENGSTVRGWPLHGISVDMGAISDTVMSLAAVACFAEGPTTIRNVAHIRH